MCGTDTYFEGLGENADCFECPSGTGIADDGTKASLHDEAGDCIVVPETPQTPIPSPLPTEQPSFSGLGPRSTIHRSSFESGWDGWTTSTFSRHSGLTTTGDTGPSSAASGTYYVYAETSAPNTPSVQFSMYRDFGEGISYISFQYHMHGSNMGTVVLKGSFDAEPLFGTADSTYTMTLWSKSGDQKDAWHTATVDTTADYPLWLKFKYTSGSGSKYTGDFALDDVAVVAGGVPTSMPTPKPVVYVETFAGLLAAIESLNEVVVTGNIAFSATITINAVTGLTIRSAVGAVLSGGGVRQLFKILGQSDVTFTGVDFKDGYVKAPTGSGQKGKGGCMIVTDSRVTIAAGTLTSCKAATSNTYCTNGCGVIHYPG